MYQHTQLFLRRQFNRLLIGNTAKVIRQIKVTGT